MPNSSTNGLDYAEILITGDVISRKHVRDIVEGIDDAIKGGKKQGFQIKADSELREIDVLFMAYLTLYKFQDNQQGGEFQFELNLKDKNRENGSFLNKLRYGPTGCREPS